MTAPQGLARRFAAHVARRGTLADGECVLVAVSGGVDSMALLHLLRFAPGLPRLELVAAHLDHAMRPDSAADAAWVRGVCAAWSVPLATERVYPAPSGEAEARAERYAFLERVRRRHGARWCVTAHHADDQAETVLFRAVRDGEPRALRGIRERRAPALWRPLLPFTRAEVEAYARGALLTWREDPSNRAPLARNVLRHRILPELEASVAPSARRSLARLARRAAEDEAAWHSLIRILAREADVRPEHEGFSFDRNAVLGLHPAVRARLLRALAADLGARPSEAGTRLAVEFTSSGPSGRSVRPAGGLELRRELDRLVLARTTPATEDRTVAIEGPEPGSADVCLEGHAWRVRWSRSQAGPEAAVTLPVGRLRFPLTVRAWRPGDRVRLPYGTKKVKKLFLEARIPRSERGCVPVVVDGTGEVLSVHGLARAVDAVPAPGEDTLTIEIADAHAD